MVALRSTVQTHPALLIWFILSMPAIYKFLLYCIVLLSLIAQFMTCCMKFSSVLANSLPDVCLTLCHQMGRG